MKTLTCITLITILAQNTITGPPQYNQDSNPDRFLIVAKGRVGFINTRGEVVIPASFESAQEFSEGLCAVRDQGRYGFINTSGQMAIPAIYDYATEFREDLALVFLDGKPCFITKEGKPAFTAPYKEMSAFIHGRSQVRTYTNKMGVIDKTGTLVIDTVYKDIDPFQDGLAIAYGLNHEPHDTDEKKKNLEITIIDDDGTRLVSYGEFEEINNYSEGYFEASMPAKKEDDESIDCLIDRTGKTIFKLQSKTQLWIEGGVHNGIFKMTLSSAKGKYSSDKTYDGYFTPEGKSVYVNKNTKEGNDFNDNRAFITVSKENLSVINQRGEFIARDRFIDIAGKGFVNGKALVRTEQGWGVIDTTANFILTPRFGNILKDGLVNDNFIFFEDTAKSEDRFFKGLSENDSTELSNYEYKDPRYGIADLQGNILVKPLFQYFDKRGFVDGLLRAWVDDRLIYINRSGQTVWQEEPLESQESQPLNIDYMNRGYFYASFENTGHGGGEKSSEPQKVTMFNSFAGAALSVVAEPDHEIEKRSKIKSFIVHVANTTGDTIRFNAQDSRLYMKTQALDPTGKWRDIEYLPSSWCGNSYHTLELPENHYWTFAAPVYEGTLPTKLRIELIYVDPTEKVEPGQRSRFLDWAYRNKRELVVYSNEFEGTINPAQFWRKPGYRPAGIMDPYNE